MGKSWKCDSRTTTTRGARRRPLPTRWSLLSPGVFDMALEINLAANGLIVLCTILWVVPVFSPERAVLFYKAATMAAFFTYSRTMYRRWSNHKDFKEKGYLATLKSPAFRLDENLHYIILCSILFASPPIPFALMPLTAFALYWVCAGAQKSILQLDESARGPSTIRGKLLARCVQVIQSSRELQSFAATS